MLPMRAMRMHVQKTEKLMNLTQPFVLKLKPCVIQQGIQENF